MFSSTTFALIALATPLLLQPVFAQKPDIVVYLTNCVTSDTGVGYSEASLYYEVANSFDGQGPDRYEDTSLGQVTTWEGADITWFYPSAFSPQADQVREFINPNAQDPAVPVNAAVGCARYVESFKDGAFAEQMICQKDNPRLLYSTSDHSCTTVYYCRVTTDGCPLPGGKFCLRLIC